MHFLHISNLLFNLIANKSSIIKTAFYNYNSILFFLHILSITIAFWCGVLLFWYILKRFTSWSSKMV